MTLTGIAWVLVKQDEDGLHLLYVFLDKSCAEAERQRLVDSGYHGECCTLSVQPVPLDGRHVIRHGYEQGNNALVQQCTSAQPKDGNG